MEAIFGTDMRREEAIVMDLMGLMVFVMERSGCDELEETGGSCHGESVGDNESRFLLEVAA